MKLLVIDDHPVFRQGLAALLNEAAPETLVLQACSAEEGVRIAEQQPQLDAVFLDLIMPGLAGEDAVREFARRLPKLPVIVLSSSEQPGDVRRMLHAGALGYIPKSASPQTLIAALQLVLSGNIYVPPLLAQVIEPVLSASNAGRLQRAPAQFTDRQLDVLRYLREGLANKEISARLGIAEKTVKAHVAAIFKALNVINRTQAAHAVKDLKLT